MRSLGWLCKGFCSDYENVRFPPGKFRISYIIHGVKFCPTCNHRFKVEDWSSFPRPRHCICCKKRMRTSVTGKKTIVDWRPRVE